jgi:hypothetical protein
VLRGQKPTTRQSRCSRQGRVPGNIAERSLGTTSKRLVLARSYYRFPPRKRALRCGGGTHSVVVRSSWGASGLRDMTSPARKDRSPPASLATAAARDRESQTLTAPVRLAIERRGGHGDGLDHAGVCQGGLRADGPSHSGAPTRSRRDHPRALHPDACGRAGASGDLLDAFIAERVPEDAARSWRGVFFPPCIPPKDRGRLPSGIAPHISRSSKPVGGGSPVVGRFDSFAAPF